jgi:hypothetical protein
MMRSYTINTKDYSMRYANTIATDCAQSALAPEGPNAVTRVHMALSDAGNLADAITRIVSQLCGAVPCGVAGATLKAVESDGALGELARHADDTATRIKEAFGELERLERATGI